VGTQERRLIKSNDRAVNTERGEKGGGIVWDWWGGNGLKFSRKKETCCWGEGAVKENL